MDSFNTTPPENPDRFYNLELNNHVRYIGSSKSASGLEVLLGRVCADGHNVVVEVSLSGTVAQDVSFILAVLEDEEGNSFEMRYTEPYEGKPHSFFLSFYNTIEHTMFKANVLFRIMLIVSPNPSWYDDLRLRTWGGKTIDAARSAIISDFGGKINVFDFTFSSDIIPIRSIVLDALVDNQEGLILSSIKCSPTETRITFDHSSLSYAVERQSASVSILQASINDRSWISRFGNWCNGDASRTMCVSEGYFYDFDNWDLRIQELQFIIYPGVGRNKDFVMNMDTNGVVGPWFFQFELPRLVF